MNTEKETPEKLQEAPPLPVKPKLNILSMVNPFLGFIVGHWKIALFLLICSVMYIQYELIRHYKAELKADNTVISTLNQSLATDNKAIEDQNTKIKKDAYDAKTKQKELDDLQKTLDKKSVNDQKIIDALRQKSSGTTCDDALKFMDDYIGTLKW